MMCWLKKLVDDEEGSAVVEFVVLALPLFIPLFIYLNQYASSSDVQASLRTLSREMARGFVTSENDAVASRVAFEIFSKGAEALGFSQELASGSLTFSFECKSSPCISPNNEIVITLQSNKSETYISTIEYVSPWA
jgi:Flp pilus assembly protein TadG